MINNTPPQPPRHQPPVTPPEYSAGYDHGSSASHASGGLPYHGMVLHDAAHGDANAFPVLKAFQDYLEQERQQARKRLIMLTVFFVSMMTLVVAGFIVAFISIFGHMSRQQDHLMDTALQQRKDALPPAPVLADLAAQQVAKEFQAVALNLQTNLGSQIASMGSAATTLGSKLESQNAEMAKQNAEMTKLRETLTALQKENASIRADLPKLALEAARKITPPTPPAPIATPAPMASAPVTPAPVVSAPVTRPYNPPTASPATTTAGTPAAATGKSPAGYDETVLSIRSRDGDSSIPWRTFVPK